jgi:hypothetical protein
VMKNSGSKLPHSTTAGVRTSNKTVTAPRELQI